MRLSSLLLVLLTTCVFVSNVFTNQVEATELLNPLGEQKTIVILFNFSDDPNNKPFTPEQVNAAVFSGPLSVNNFYTTNSYGRTWLTGQVTGWYTTSILKGPGCYSSNAAREAVEMARGAGIPIDTYTRRIYLHAYNPNCGNGGSGSTGGYTYTESTINGTTDLYVLSHEFGHNLGLGHAHSLDCGAAMIAPYYLCTKNYYGDHLSSMGHGGALGHHNIFHKQSLGWVTQNQVPEITKSGIYTINPLELSGQSIYGVKVRKEDTQEYYYVEYRQPTDPGGYSGTYIHVGYTVPVYSTIQSYVAAETYLLDTTPNSPQGFYDSNLSDGTTFTDQTNNIQITQLSHSTSSTTLNISVVERIPTRLPILPESATLQTTHPPIHFSTLLYDENNKPIWSGVTYEWGISSQNTVGTLFGVNGNIASFQPLNAGTGQLYVKATYNDQTIVSSIPLSVTSSPTFNLTDLRSAITGYMASADDRYWPKDNKINLLDLGYVIRWNTP